MEIGFVAPAGTVIGLRVDASKTQTCAVPSPTQVASVAGSRQREHSVRTRNVIVGYYAVKRRRDRARCHQLFASEAREPGVDELCEDTGGLSTDR